MMDYYYEEEAEQFSFYRIPKVLFTEPQFKDISAEAKIVYGLMLDRMSLSRKNHWVDEEKRVFIYYTLEEIMEYMSVSHSKAINILKELDKSQLISRVKQGQGKPTIIYLKNFLSCDFTKTEVKTSQKQKSRVHKNGSQDFRKNDANNTDKSNTDKSNTEKNNTESISLSENEHQERQERETEDNVVVPKEQVKEQAEDVVEVIKSNIDYDLWFADSADAEKVDNIVNVLADAISTQTNVRVNGTNLSVNAFKSRIMKLDSGHIQYALIRMERNTTPIRNVRNYILTLMFNAPLEMIAYYQADYQASRGG